MDLTRLSPAILSVFLFGVASGVLAGDPSEPAQSVLPAAKLAAALDERPEVQFLSFTKSGSIVIGGVAPYASRAAASDDASRLSWNSAAPANWVEWYPSAGALTRILSGAAPKNLVRMRKDGLLPSLPDTWVAGDSDEARKRVSVRDVQAALKPKSFNPEIVAVSPDGAFAVVTNYEDKDDEMGELVFLRTGKDGWKRIGKEQAAVFVADPKFSPTGDLLAFQYQTDGYDGPEPWALISTKSGADLLAKVSAAPPKAAKGILPYAIAVKSDAVAVGWSDGSVTVQGVDRLKR